MPDLRKKIANFINGREVLILGFGKEGRSTYRNLRRCIPELPICIADQNGSIGEEADLLSDDYLSFNLGEDYLQALDSYDLVFKSPGISFKSYSVPPEQQITSQTDLFIELFRKQIIGVTGTKGKSTTVSLLYHLLKSQAKKVMLVGNIGLPALEVMQDIDDDSWIVYELSSHQLEFVNHSPHIAVFLNLFEEHLDHYNSYLDYQLAKANITKYQSSNDFLIYNHSNSLVNKRVEDVGSKATKLAFGDDKSNRASCFVDESVRLYSSQIYNVDLHRIPLLGTHNQLNILAALNVCSALQMDIAQCVEAIYSFKSLPHRLESVGVYGGIHFVNDSIATIPEACIKAVETFNNLGTLILGGFNRGIDYQDLVDYLMERRLPNLIFLGEVGQIIRKTLEAKSYAGYMYNADTMEEVVQLAYTHTAKESVCLLSPAASSYDSFHNFEDRGNQYKKKVQEYVSHL